MFATSLLAVVASFLALLALSWQTRLLRKTLEANTYQSLLDKIIAARGSIVVDQQLGEMFNENLQIKAVLQAADMTISEFFWILQFLTSWENFYQQRRMGLLGDQSWDSYKNTMRLALGTPKIRKFWLQFSQHSNYRSDWEHFINQICNGEDPTDPLLPRLVRMLRRTT
jgi:hypothetical protein